MSKVFGIGLSRTGTKSLSRALSILGYDCIHFPQSIAEIEAHDAACDTPVALGYRFLDLMYPGSKFILTVRNPSEWIESCKRYWSEHLKDQSEFHRKLHTGLYGAEDFTWWKFQHAFNSHIVGAFAHFWTRKDDLLAIDICRGEGREKLCPFLGKEIPCEPFPHLNASPQRT